jgi:hypothetical protein
MNTNLLAGGGFIMHLSRVIVPLLSMVSVSGAADAAAQDNGKTGITMGYPAAVGIVTHITDRVAIRPELNVSFSSGTTELFPFADTRSDGSAIGIGVSALIYLGTGDKLRPYFSPRYTFARTSSSSNSELRGSSESTSTSHTVAGSFGVQYALHDRFSIFGEVGVGHAVNRQKIGITESRSESRQTGTRSGVGVIFYF